MKIKSSDNFDLGVDGELETLDLGVDGRSHDLLLKQSSTSASSVLSSWIDL